MTAHNTPLSLVLLTALVALPACDDWDGPVMAPAGCGSLAVNQTIAGDLASASIYVRRPLSCWLTPKCSLATSANA